MQSAMSSAERMMATITLREPDHVPLVLRFHRPELPQRIRFTDELDRIDKMLSLGVDDWLHIRIRQRLHPEVRTESWVEHPEGERYPLLHKVYRTPRGDLMQIVRRTDDWVDGNDVRLLSNHNIPRSTRFLVETEQDLGLLPYIFADFTADAIDEFRDFARAMRREADRRKVIVVGGSSGGSDIAIHLCGLDNFLIASKERPWFVKEVLHRLHEREMKVLDLILDVGVCDVIERTGWSESSTHWSPTAYREFFFAHVKEGVERAHQAGVKHIYDMHTGIAPMIPALLELGTDMLYGIDPVQGGAELGQLKRELGRRLCLMGGVNSYLTLSRGSRAEIRAAVREAISTLGPGGGFILFPMDAVDWTTPWSNVEILLEAWREWREYPLTV